MPDAPNPSPLDVGRPGPDTASDGIPLGVSTAVSEATGASVAVAHVDVGYLRLAPAGAAAAGIDLLVEKLLGETRGFMLLLLRQAEPVMSLL